MAEHRLWYAADLADRVFYLREGQLEQIYTGAEFLALPEEKRRSMGLRSLTEVPLPEPHPTAETGGLTVRGLRASYGGRAVWQDVSFTAPRGQITAITGHNGAGKTTLARCLCGLMKEQAGTILWGGSLLGRKERRRRAFLIMQDVNLQLFGDSVLAEARLGSTATEQEALAALEQMDLVQYAQAHPLALSGGQKQRLAIVDGCLSGKELLIFDEPTSGLDYAHMLEVSRLLRELAERGCACWSSPTTGSSCGRAAPEPFPGCRRNDIMSNAVNFPGEGLTNSVQQIKITSLFNNDVILRRSRCAF